MTADRRFAAWRRPLGCAAGLLLIALAIGSAWRTGDSAAAWSTLRDRPWWAVALLAALPAANWALSGLALWVLSRRRGPVGAGEMLALVGAAWLLNYAPLRPGLFGRVAYHKVRHGMAVRDSVAILVVSTLLGVAAAAILVAASSIASLAAAWVIALPPALIAAAGALAGRQRRAVGPIAAALVLRYADMLAWAARYLVAFWLLGLDPPLTATVAVAAVSQLVSLVPLAGNGLGLREWAVGLSTAVLDRAGVLPGATTGDVLALGLSVDLLNRAGEVACVAVVGPVCAGWVAWRVRGGGAPRSPERLVRPPDPADLPVRTDVGGPRRGAADSGGNP